MSRELEYVWRNYSRMARALRRLPLQMAKNVLIVDDDGNLRQIFAMFLQAYGYETSEAASGHEAIETALSRKPDLILLDLHLPDMRGTDIAQILRKDPLTAHIPIICCSAYSSVEFREDVSRFGITQYLEKPFSAADIFKIVDQFIH